VYGYVSKAIYLIFLPRLLSLCPYARDVRQERDVLAQMVRTLQEREHAAGPRLTGGAGSELKAAGAAAAAELKKASSEMKNKVGLYELNAV
jgi:hypothetical protein